MSGASKEYASSVLNPFLKDVVNTLLVSKPAEPLPFLMAWLEQKLGLEEQLSEKEELHRLRQEVARLKSMEDKGSEEEKTDSEEEEQVEELPERGERPSRHRSAVSAEAYGHWNKKEDFRPRVIPKSQELEQQ
jgi:cAMP-dependent protein kinase regulator